LENEKVVLGRIDSIIEAVAENRIGVPAIIVLGEVVAKHQQFEQVKKELLSTIAS